MTIGDNKTEVEFAFEHKIDVINNDMYNNRMDGLEERLEELYQYAYHKEDNDKIAFVLFCKGNLARLTNRPNESISCYREALTLYKTSKNKKKILSVYNNLGIVYMHLGASSEALESYFYALEIVNSTSQFEFTKSSILINIGNIYYKWEDFENALHIYLEAYELLLKDEIKTNIALVTFNIATAYFFQGQYDLAKEYNEIAIKLSLECNQKFAVLINEVVKLMLEYGEERDYETFIVKYTNVLERLADITAYENYSIVVEFVGKAMFSINEHEYALAILEDLYTKLKEHKYYNKADGIRTILIKIYIHKDDYKSAYLIKEDTELDRLYYLDKGEQLKVFETFKSIQNKGTTWKKDDLLKVIKLLAQVGEGIISNYDIKNVYKYITKFIIVVWKLDFWGMSIKNTEDQLEYFFDDEGLGTNNNSQLGFNKDLMDYLIYNTDEVVLYSSGIDSDNKHQLPKAFIDSIESSNIRSLVFAPIYKNKQVVGGLLVQNCNNDYFGHQDIVILKALASYCGAALNQGNK